MGIRRWVSRIGGRSWIADCQALPDPIIAIPTEVRLRLGSDNAADPFSRDFAASAGVNRELRTRKPNGGSSGTREARSWAGSASAMLGRIIHRLSM
jgi:hypothetical protein